MNDFASKLYIDGRWCAGAGGKRFPVINPATGRKIAAVADGEVARWARWSMKMRADG